MLNTKCIAAAVNCALWHFFLTYFIFLRLFFFCTISHLIPLTTTTKTSQYIFLRQQKKSILSVLFFVHEFSWKISRRHVKIAFVLSGRKYSFLTLFLLFFERRLFKRNFSRQEPCIQLLPWFLFYYI